ncbi:Nitrilase/cyanide hydratase and apolipoprotein N-acyltransferase family protein [Hibiscus syriacus]|uniref:Nitrilase/cyanide hydratase and apolipoprotein N-acyltransferase family protein n=1 Tax=Hibiscus syriacus TaxID=106335 RepID=A0A6A3BIV5_HIBSY|nr:Nitrilase/cyanide hydratase and apolipoprotein N-acyltransferase family protein [Hibiscus syriacus]
MSQSPFPAARKRFSPISDYLRHSNSINQLKQTHALFLKTLLKTQYYHFLTLFLAKLLHVPGDYLGYARQVFDQIPNCKREFLWTSLIRSHVFNGYFMQSILLYSRMQRKGISPSGFTFSSVLNACARIPAMFEGKQVHAGVEKSGLLRNNILQTSLLDMYAKCGFMLDAERVFNGMEKRDVVAWTAMICGYTKVGLMDEARFLFDDMEGRNMVSWTTMVAGYANCGDMEAAEELYDRMMEKNPVACLAMIAGYGKCGDVSKARRMFDEIVKPDASCWAAMLVCYAQNGYAKEAIGTFRAIRVQNLGINEVGMVGAISACTQIGDVSMAEALAKDLEEGCCERTLFVSNALIHMHAKCGCIEQAWMEFCRMKQRDVVSYSTMITALADHGESQVALALLSKMQRKESSQTKLHSEHLTCMVDLLGRAGHLEKAYTLIIEYGDSSDSGIWGALLGACKVYGNAPLGEIASSHLFEIEPEDVGNYVLLANVYASLDKWNDAERLKKMISEKEKRKSPGCSWVPS